MAKEITSKSFALRPVWLTLVFCAALGLGGLDLIYGTTLIGAVLIMAAAGIYAVIASLCRPVLSVLCAAGGVGILLAVADTAPHALIGAAFVAPAVVIALSVRKKKEKTATVLLAGVSLIVYLFMLLLICRAVAGQPTAPKEMLAELAAWYDSLRLAVKEVLAEALDALPQEQIAMLEKMSGTAFSEVRGTFLELTDDLFGTIRLLSPGILLMLTEILSYLAVEFFCVATRVSHLDALIPEARWRILPTSVTAIVFYGCSLLFVVTMFFSGTVATGICFIAENLLLVLLPCMVLCGFRGIGARLRHPQTRGRMLFLLLLFVAGFFFLFFMAIPAILITAALLGARDILAIRSAEAESEASDEDRQ